MIVLFVVLCRTERKELKLPTENKTELRASYLLLWLLIWCEEITSLHCTGTHWQVSLTIQSRPTLQVPNSAVSISEVRCGRWCYQGQISTSETSLDAPSPSPSRTPNFACRDSRQSVALYLPVKHDRPVSTLNSMNIFTAFGNKNFHLKSPKTLCYIKFYEQFPNSCTKLLVWWKSNNLFYQLLLK